MNNKEKYKDKLKKLKEKPTLKNVAEDLADLIKLLKNRDII